MSDQTYIVIESLVPNGTTPVQDGFESGIIQYIDTYSIIGNLCCHSFLDYKKHIEEYLDTNTPAYIFIRFDEKSSTDEYKWLFLCYVPDNAKVRDKMIYASTRATLTRELGDYRFTDSIYGTDKVSKGWKE